MSRSEAEPGRPIAWSEPGRMTTEIVTGGWRTRRPVYVEATAPCRHACPAGEAIPRWIERARAGDVAGAWRLLREENPLPAVTGRVCAHPCEHACHRTALDGAVAINALERWVGDWGLRHGAEERPTGRVERVAVVGGGPAGLACAYHLARRGYRVTIFEAQRELGGLLRYGIPGYRLPRPVLDGEIELILSLGVEVETGHRLDAGGWAGLAGFDAVFAATGATLPLGLDVPGDGARGVMDGLAFLHAVNTGERPDVGARVAVIGGGSSAMDVARTARRLGAAAVTVLTLEARDAMPAIRDEVAQALAEGVELRSGIGVRAFLERDGVVSAVVTAPAELHRGPDGTIVPRFRAGAEIAMSVDRVVLAVGQRPDPRALPVEVEMAQGLVAIAPDGGTSAPRYYAGGDVASRERTVAHAIGSGTRAARAIHARLDGGMEPSPQGDAGDGMAGAWVAPRPGHVVSPAEIRPSAFPSAHRVVRRERLPSARATAFVEVVEGLDDAAARGETMRCFTCGRCVGCDTCFLVCPDIAIGRLPDGYRVSTAHCKGCGLCVHECPRGAMQMVDER